MAAHWFARKADDEKGSRQMRIGILTFHSQLNYGGVLQCWALQTALEKMGHEVVVIDHRLRGSIEISQMFGFMDIRRWLRSIFGMWLIPGSSCFVRCIKTRRFIRKRLNLSSYHFVNWKDAPANLGVDGIIVGSDQVWRCLDGMDPSPYLLIGAPSIPAIAYAASFGMPTIPPCCAQVYKEGLSRFDAISSREAEGVEICKALGYPAIHVLDPTILDVDFKTSLQLQKHRELVCYFLSEKIDEVWKPIVTFARNMDCQVKIYSSPTIVPCPIGKKKGGMFLRMFLRQFESKVKIEYTAGPEEFAAAFRNAKWVVSDSFHALMFSIRNNCNVRIIKPSKAMRQSMFARIREFAGHTQGPVIVDSVEEALSSFVRGESVKFDFDWILARQAESRNWLRSALENMVK